MRVNLSAKFKAQSGEWVLPQSPSGEKFQALNLNNGRAMNAMEFTEIYAALVREAMRQARRQTASRSPRGFNGEFEP